jgi:hypothetical protein
MVWIPLTDSNVGGAMGARVVVVWAGSGGVVDAVVAGLTATVLNPSAVVVVTCDP